MLERKSTPQPVALGGGMYIGKVIGHLDSTYMGSLLVELQRNIGNNPKSDGSSFVVKYASPFFGSTSLSHNSMGTDYDSTQKSYGFWAIPPDKDTLVLCAFVEGDPKRGYWFACIPDTYMNFMVPGTPAFTGEDGSKTPVAEYNKKVFQGDNDDPTLIPKPVHPFTEVLKVQGLLNDEFRGITTSGARREAPSAVFGWSTPGPIDRRDGAPRGSIGRKETTVDTAFVSRLGGSSFVMDDGDDKLLRVGDPSISPPEYVSVENGKVEGDVTRPHNDLVRIRTRTGHQIVFHNSEDFIYVSNSKGTAWFELTSRGKIDVYATESISMNTLGDYNINAGGSINIKGNALNIKSATKSVIETGNILSIKSADTRLNTSGNCDMIIGGGLRVKSDTVSLQSSGKLVIKSDGKIGIQGGSSITASAPNIGIESSAYIVNAARISHNGGGSVPSSPDADNPENTEDANDPSRVPQHEPWGGHENLNPLGSEDVKTYNIPDTFRKGKQ